MTAQTPFATSSNQVTASSAAVLPTKHAASFSSSSSGTMRTMPSSDDTASDDHHAPRPLHHDNGNNEHHHKTTVWQTFVHLVKGYIGPGCLSLPWAMSQLGIIPGVLLCFALAAWSSYNCWIVVDLKRQLMANNNNNNSGTTATTTTTQRQLTYPDVAGHLYGPRAQRLTALSVGTQQLAICTVFFSFCGDNLQAVLNGFLHSHVDASHPGFSHTAVITFCFPIVLALAMIPNLKSLASASVFGTVLLMIGLAILGILVLQEWSDRPPYDPTTGFPYFNTQAVPQYPLAACALLYSYEGICLILPIESAMQAPEHFRATFSTAMCVAALTFSVVASLAVYVFGSIADGSLTAFLLEHYGSSTTDDGTAAPQELIWLLWLANAAVSLSVLVTFPLQLFPALELIQQALPDSGCFGLLGRGRTGPTFTRVQTNEEEEDDHETEQNTQQSAPPRANSHCDDDEHGVSSVFTIDDEEDEEDDIIHVYSSHEETDMEAAPQSVQEEFVDEPMQEEEQVNQDTDHNYAGTGEYMSSSNILLRISLVLFTYVIAIVVPNVQSLIALAGALAGSLTALVLPPILAMKRGGGVWSWISLILGTSFGLVGTVAALMDIVKSKE